MYTFCFHERENKISQSDCSVTNFLLSNNVKDNDILYMNAFQRALMNIQCILNEIFPR